MGKTRTKKLKEMFLKLKSENGEIVERDKIMTAIFNDIGSDMNQTVRPTIKTINDLKMLEDLPDGRYKILV